MIPSQKGDHCAIHTFLYFLAWGNALPSILISHHATTNAYLSLIFTILEFVILWLPNEE